MQNNIQKVMRWIIVGQCAVLLILLLGVWDNERATTVSARMPNLQFIIGESAVDVRRSGQTIQKIPFEPSALTEQNRAFFIRTPDINFDGYPDLTLIFSQGAQNIYYDGWVWDQKTGQFIHDPIIRTLSSPVFDAENQRIYTYEHGSATDHVSSTYAYQNGTLTEIERIEQSFDERTQLFAIRTYARRDGQLKLVGEEKLTPAQLDARDQS